MKHRLKPGDHIHLMGICGTAMASLAGLLKERGFKVTGSDQNVYPPMSTFLEKQGIEIQQGYKASNLDSNPDFVVVGNVISKHFEEAQALLQKDIPYASLPETLRDFVIEDRHSMVVAGTHGKTTTTSMLSWMCEKEGLKPGFLIGGIAKNFEGSFQNPKGDHFVIEGDEYDTAFFAKVPKFSFYKPRSVILGNIEFDHADIYSNLDEILKAFKSLMELIPDNEGLLVHNAEDKNVQGLLKHCKAQKVSYGQHEGDWTLSHLEFLRQGIEFDVNYKGKVEEKIFIPMFGGYNALNGLAVYALCKTLGFKSDLRSSFRSFQGVKRRQELIGEPGGIQVIEDFAHHPTAVKATIASLQGRKDRGRLFALFEPRSNTSRRNIFQKEYEEAFLMADESFLCRPASGTQKMNSADFLDVDKIASKINETKNALVFEDVEVAIAEIKSRAKKGDTVLIMSNGSFQGIYQKILKVLAS